MALWLDAIPHPMIACEIATDYVAAARWTRTGVGLDGFAVEPLPPGAILPTAAESNLINAAEVRAAVGRVFSRLRAKEEEVALLVPDAVIRVFVLHFDVFPRSPDEAIPILRWRLKKSVPFEAEETLISYMRQAPREDGVDIVTALARLRIVREYESLMESVGNVAGRGDEFDACRASPAFRWPPCPSGARRRNYADDGNCSGRSIVRIPLHYASGGCHAPHAAGPAR